MEVETTGAETLSNIEHVVYVQNIFQQHHLQNLRENLSVDLDFQNKTKRLSVIESDIILLLYLNTICSLHRQCMCVYAFVYSFHSFFVVAIMLRLLRRSFRFT